MSYTNETTHYGIPLPLGTDLTTPMDYNASMQALDTAVFGAVTDASAGVQKANAIEEALGTTNDNVSALTGRVTTAEGTIVTQGNAITQLQLDIADTKADALDMICAVDEGTAQVATVAVQKGKYFRYNDVLYMATANIAIGDTIVPNTNCRATNVATELENTESSVQTFTPNVSVTADGTKSQRTLLNELYALIDTTKITPNTKLVYIDSDNLTSQFMLTRNTVINNVRHIQFGGTSSNSPQLDFSNINLDPSTSYVYALSFGNVNDTTTMSIIIAATDVIPASGRVIGIIY